MARFPQAVDVVDQNQGTFGLFDHIRCTALPLHVVTGRHCAVAGFRPADQSHVTVRGTLPDRITF
jgi:hypothetical protein